jgi:hypothetical protein
MVQGAAPSALPEASLLSGAKRLLRYFLFFLFSFPFSLFCICIHLRPSPISGVRWSDELHRT